MLYSQKDVFACLKQKEKRTGNPLKQSINIQTPYILKPGRKKSSFFFFTHYSIIGITAFFLMDGWKLHIIFSLS